MEYNEGSQLDSSQVTSGGGGGGRVAVGGGIGTMILLFILSQVFGVDLTGLAGGGQSQSSSQSQGKTLDQCRTGGDIRQNRECRFVAYTNSIQAYWGRTLQGYQMTRTNLFNGQTQTACGAATAAVGPFYCPADQIVYLDQTFFDDMLKGQLGAQGGDAAEAYVIAHEYGHHISNQMGVMDRVQQGETGPTSGSVRLELQADCYAGAWLKNATADPNGPIKSITQDDLNRAVDAAKSVGDDRIQQMSQGRVNPEQWTHGSAAMRKNWLAQGYNSGDPRQCDTFAANARVA